MVIFTDFHDHKKLELEKTLNPLLLLFFNVFIYKSHLFKAKNTKCKIITILFYHDCVPANT